MPNKSATGFTLVELAIVLFIVTLLLGGMLTPLTRQISEGQQRETRRILEDARLGVTGYALAHRTPEGRPYLPCPDRRDGVDAGDGREDRDQEGQCAVTAGLLPWHTLGVADADAWGNRLGYAVAPALANPRLGLGLAVEASPEICPDHACRLPQTAAVVLLSHGRNGLGARNAMGNANLAPVSLEEKENADASLRFIQHPPRDQDRPGGEYDDLIVAISPAWLLGRLCDPASLCTAMAAPK